MSLDTVDRGWCLCLSLDEHEDFLPGSFNHSQPGCTLGLPGSFRNTVACTPAPAIWLKVVSWASGFSKGPQMVLVGRRGGALLLWWAGPCRASRTVHPSREAGLHCCPVLEGRSTSWPLYLPCGGMSWGRNGYCFKILVHCFYTIHIFQLISIEIGNWV